MVARTCEQEVTNQGLAEKRTIWFIEKPFFIPLWEGAILKERSAVLPIISAMPLLHMYGIIYLGLVPGLQLWSFGRNIESDWQTER